MDLAPDFDEFIGSLIAHEVEFLIVGAYALAFHGAPRYTGDIDILIRPTIENARRALATIASFGFPITNLTPSDLVDSRRMLEMGIEPVQIHVMSSISGVTWDEAWEGRVIAPFGHGEAPLIGLDAFLRNKRAAGRPKDLADVDALMPGHGDMGKPDRND
jgi:hypothetical protein